MTTRVLITNDGTKPVRLSLAGLEGVDLGVLMPGESFQVGEAQRLGEAGVGNVVIHTHFVNREKK